MRLGDPVFPSASGNCYGGFCIELESDGIVLVAPANVTPNSTTYTVLSEAGAVIAVSFLIVPRDEVLTAPAATWTSSLQQLVPLNVKELWRVYQAHSEASEASMRSASSRSRLPTTMASPTLTSVSAEPQGLTAMMAMLQEIKGELHQRRGDIRDLQKRPTTTTGSRSPPPPRGRTWDDVLGHGGDGDGSSDGAWGPPPATPRALGSATPGGLGSQPSFMPMWAPGLAPPIDRRSQATPSFMLDHALHGRHQVGTALRVQGQKRLPQYGLDNGEWSSASLLWPEPDALSSEAFGGSEQEMRRIHAYKKAVSELRSKNRGDHDNEDQHQTPAGTGQDKKKGGKNGKKGDHAAAADT